MDLFVSRAYHQIPTHMTWRPDTQSHVTDAFQQNWTEWDFSLHFPFFTDQESSFKSKNRESFDHTSHHNLASATLAQSNSRIVRRGITNFTPIK